MIHYKYFSLRGSFFPLYGGNYSTINGTGPQSFTRGPLESKTDVKQTIHLLSLYRISSITQSSVSLLTALMSIVELERVKKKDYTNSTTENITENIDHEATCV